MFDIPKLNRHTIVWMLNYLVIVLGFLLLISPYVQVFNPIDNRPEVDCWENLYILTSLDLFLMFVPMYIMVIIFELTKKQKVRKILALFVFGFALLDFLNALMGCLLPIQDLVPSYGIALSLLFLPLIVIKLIMGVVSDNPKNANFNEFFFPTKSIE